LCLPPCVCRPVSKPSWSPSLSGKAGTSLLVLILPVSRAFVQNFGPNPFSPTLLPLASAQLCPFSPVSPSFFIKMAVFGNRRRVAGFPRSGFFSLFQLGVPTFNLLFPLKPRVDRGSIQCTFPCRGVPDFYCSQQVRWKHRPNPLDVPSLRPRTALPFPLRSSKLPLLLFSPLLWPSSHKFQVFYNPDQKISQRAFSSPSHFWSNKWDFVFLPIVSFFFACVKK